MFLSVNVFFKDTFCGVLTYNTVSRHYTFKYDPNYVKAKSPIISVNLPLQYDGFESVTTDSLHAFFDNLAAEGWLRDRQSDALKMGGEVDTKFNRLIHFGFDMAGAVHFGSSGEKFPLTIQNGISIESLASVSGVQKKLLVKFEHGGFAITKQHELSTHIAKLGCSKFPNIIELEFFSTLAMRHLLPDDSVCNITIGYLNELKEQALFVERFDRSPNGERIHFEEFNSLLDKLADNKYDASYDDIGKFIRQCNMCSSLTVYKRVLASILIGNTDAHLKNFAMFHTEGGQLTLTPMYDIVSSSFYPELGKKLALKINRHDYEIHSLKPKHLVSLGRTGFGLSDSEIMSAVNSLETNKKATFENLKRYDDDCICKIITNALVETIDKRWNGSFRDIKKILQK